MDCNPAILGKHTSDVLKERETSAVLVIGADRFSRKDLASVSCFNFLAADRLTKLLSHELKAKNTADVFNNVNPRALALPGLGHISFATLGAAFEARRLGTLTDYYEHHMHNGNAVSFGSLKHQQEKEDAAPKPRRAVIRRGRSNRRKPLTQHRARL